MEIKNEEHAREMLRKWQELPLPAQKREIRFAMEKLELDAMYYAQKGNDRGAERAQSCIDILSEYADGLE